MLRCCACIQIYVQVPFILCTHTIWHTCLHASMRACRSHTHLYEFIRAKLAAGVAEGAVKGDARKVGVGDVHTRVEVLHCVCVCVCVCARARARVRASVRACVCM